MYGTPWIDADDGWTAADRAAYEAARRATKAGVLLDGGTGSASARVPAVLRESLLSMWSGDPGDAELRRELGRLGSDPAEPDAAA